MQEDKVTAVKELLNKTEVSLILDTYDDIFSDFDPRPYNERTLSEDFLAAAKKEARDKGEGLQLNLMVPKAVRNSANEELIRQRLKEHFRRHYRLVKAELTKRRRRALTLITIGVIVGLIDAFVLYTPTTFNLSAVFTEAVGIILTPASWYTIWTGFDLLLVIPKEDAAEEAFYKKMRGVIITFSTYENNTGASAQDSHPVKQ